MKRIAVFVVAVLVALPLAAETWKNVPLMDANCAGRPDLANNSDKHSRTCALRCSKSGYGAIIDGSFVKFDANGSAMAKKALEKSKQKDHLRATVTGELDKGEIKVSALTLD